MENFEYFDFQVYKEREVYVKEWRKRKRLVIQKYLKMATILKAGVPYSLYRLYLGSLSGIRHDECHPRRVSEEQKRVSGKYKYLISSTSLPQSTNEISCVPSQDEVGVETDEDCKVVVPSS